MAPANTARLRRQDPFAVLVKIKLIQMGWTITDLANALSLQRNTVSLAINRGLFQPTRIRIAEFLHLPLPQ